MLVGCVWVFSGANFRVFLSRSKLLLLSSICLAFLTCELLDETLLLYSPFCFVS